MHTYIVHWSANGLRQREQVQAYNTVDAQRQVIDRLRLAWWDVYNVVLVVD